MSGPSEAGPTATAATRKTGRKTTNKIFQFRFQAGGSPLAQLCFFMMSGIFIYLVPFYTILVLVKLQFDFVSYYFFMRI